MSKNSKEKCSITCPLTGFNFCCNKGMAIGMALMSVWTVIWCFIWHHKIMADAYTQTAYLWRPMAEMEQFGIYMLGGNILLAAVFTYIFAKGREGKGWKEGLRFGLIITLLMATVAITMYATQPIPTSLIQMWILGDAIHFIAGGIMLNWWFSKK